MVDVQGSTEFLAEVDLGLGGGNDELLFSSLVNITGTGNLNGGGGSQDVITSMYQFANWMSGDPTVNGFELFVF